MVSLLLSALSVLPDNINRDYRIVDENTVPPVQYCNLYLLCGKAENIKYNVDGMFFIIREAIHEMGTQLFILYR